MSSLVHSKCPIDQFGFERIQYIPSLTTQLEAAHAAAELHKTKAILYDQMMEVGTQAKKRPRAAASAAVAAAPATLILKMLSLQRG